MRRGALNNGTPKRVTPSQDADGAPAGGMTRRAFFKGSAAAVVGAVASGTVAAASLAASGCSSTSSSSSDVPTTLMVSNDQLQNCTEDYEQLDPEGRFNEDGVFQLPQGSMVFSASNNTAVVLVPGETASPLSQVKVLNLENGVLSSLLDNAVSESEGYEIYDVRASNTVIAWSEYSYLTSAWRLYTSTISSRGALGEVIKLDEGDYNWDPPQFCVLGNQVIWNYLPYEEGSYSQDPSYVKRASGNGSNGSVIYTSNGRLNTQPEQSDGVLTIVPRADTNGVYFTMVAMDPSSGDIKASITLPRSMRVLNAIYMNDAFTFSVEASYDSESAIAKLGTYRDLGDGNWLRVARTPMCTPAMVGDRLVVKAGKGLMVVDPGARQYFNIAAPAYSWDYGECLACAGTCDKILTYATVDSGNDVRSAFVQLRLISLI